MQPRVQRKALKIKEHGDGGAALQRAEAAYAAAADHYDRPALSFWNRFGEQTIKQLGLNPGQHVLDLCCGAGASAIAAARAVGPTGRVLGIDIAEPLLQLARTRACSEGLVNVEFRRADAGNTGLPTGTFDAVICVFGVFFAPDMRAIVAEMWRLVRPGGRLAVTTWGPGLFEPANGIFWDAVRDIEPSLYKAFNPWDVITTAPALTELLRTAQVPEAEAHELPAQHELARPDDFWDVVLGGWCRTAVRG